MGYNTAIIVLNDGLSFIEKDPEFGSKLGRAVSRLSSSRDLQDISAGPHVNAAAAISSRHADSTQLVAIGGNYGSLLGTFWNGGTHHTEEAKLDLLKKWADSLGYRVVKKASK
jgi:hypothetical protein